MKQLIWKELRQHRLIPLSGAALVAAIMLAWRSGDPSLSASNMDLVLWVLVVVAGLLPGSESIAPEVGGNTLPFLLSLPLSRGRIWLAKVGSGLLITFATAIAGAIAFGITLHVLYGRDPVLTPFSFGLPEVILTLCYGYAVSLFFSTLVDRTISALTLTVFAGLVITGVFLQTMASKFGFASEYYGLALLATAVSSLMVASYMAFRSGGSMRTPRRVLVGISALLVCMTAGIGVITGVNAIRIRALGITTVQNGVERYELRYIMQPGHPYKTVSVDAGDVTISTPREFMVRFAPGDAAASVPAFPLTAHDTEYLAGGATKSHVIPANDPLLTRSASNGLPMPGVKVAYVPRMPIGPDNQTIEVLTSTGQVAGTVEIHANKRTAGP